MSQTAEICRFDLRGQGHWRGHWQEPARDFLPARTGPDRRCHETRRSMVRGLEQATPAVWLSRGGQVNCGKTGTTRSIINIEVAAKFSTDSNLRIGRGRRLETWAVDLPTAEEAELLVRVPGTRRRRRAVTWRASEREHGNTEKAQATGSKPGSPRGWLMVLSEPKASRARRPPTPTAWRSRATQRL